MNLAEIDEFVEAARGAMTVSPLAIEESGVDPIGLRQLNLDMMDAAVPGINNTTMHIRPYAFMAWAWAKAFDVLRADGEVHSIPFEDLVARYEAFYAWAHSLAGTPLSGATAIRKFLPLRGSSAPFLFAGSNWEEFKKRRLSFMAATEYGPSLKALRILKPTVGGGFKPCTEFATVVANIDSIVASSIPERLLARDPPTVEWEEVLPLAEKLPVTNTSEAEREAFRLLFFEGGGKTATALKDIHRRRATIELIQAILPEQSEISIAEIRRRLASESVSSVLREQDAEIDICATLFTILQARQLQRQAIEAMMVWIERALPRPLSDEHAAATGSHAKSTEELAKAADELCAEESSTVGEYVDAVAALAGDRGWPAAAALSDTDVVQLMEKLSEAQRRDVSAVPKLALFAIGVVYSITKACTSGSVSKLPNNFIESRQDRLPMGLMARRIDMLRDKPLRSLWNEIIERWVIAQHVHWSAVRGGDGKQRLRIGLEGGGWIRVGTRPIRPFAPTPDRLATLLSLGSECGLFRRGAMTTPSYGRQLNGRNSRD